MKLSTQLQQRPRGRRSRVPRQQQPNMIRLGYFRGIKAGVLEPMRAFVGRYLIPELPGLVAQAARERGDHTDSAHSYTQKVIEDLTRQYLRENSVNHVEALARKFGERTSDFQRQQLGRQLKAATGVDVLINEPHLTGRLEQFAAQNVTLIKSVPVKYFGEIEKLTLDALRTGDRPAEIAAALGERFDVAESDAMRIARDQIGKLYGSLNQVRQESLGITGFIWRGVLDNRERDEHVEREGKWYSWDDPPEDGIPGEPIQCRCFAEPDLSNLLEE